MLSEIKQEIKQTWNPWKKFVLWRFHKKFKNYWMDVVDESIWKYDILVDTGKYETQERTAEQAFSRLDINLPNGNYGITNQESLRDYLWRDNRDVEEVLMDLSLRTIQDARNIVFPQPNFTEIMKMRYEKGVESDSPEGKITFIKTLIHDYQKDIPQDKIDSGFKDYQKEKGNGN